MSHFCVVVFTKEENGSDVEKLMAPYEEALKVEWVDETENYKKQYEKQKVSEFYCNSSSSWGYKLSKEMFDKIAQSKVGANFFYELTDGSGFASYLKQGGKYCGYYELEDHKRCKESVWFEVVKIISNNNHPNENVCFKGEVLLRKINPPKKIKLKDRYPSYDDYLQDWHGVENLEKQGYWHNPKAKWDWWVIGGRWDGVILNLPEINDGQGGFNFGDQFHTPERNSCKVSEIKEDFCPFAFVTPDGKWHERGRMGWWAAVSDEMAIEKWKEMFKKAVQKHKNCTAVLLDCHI